MSRKVLNFGCGNKVIDGAINVDIQEGDYINKSFDFERFPYPFKDNTFDEVHCNYLLEHLQTSPIKVCKELHRIIKPKGLLYIKVPYARSILQLDNPDHYRVFTERTFWYICNQGGNYIIQRKIFNIRRLELVPTWYGKHIPRFLRKYVNYLFNEIYDRIFVTLEVRK